MSVLSGSGLTSCLWAEYQPSSGDSSQMLRGTLKCMSTCQEWILRGPMSSQRILSHLIGAVRIPRQQKLDLRILSARYDDMYQQLHHELHLSCMGRQYMSVLEKSCTCVESQESMIPLDVSFEWSAEPSQVGKDLQHLVKGMLLMTNPHVRFALQFELLSF